MSKVTILLLISICCLTASAHNFDTEKLEDIFYRYTYLSETQVLGVSEYWLITLDLYSGHKAPWKLDWNPESEGWRTMGYWYMTVSPNEEWVLIARSMGLPDDFEYYIPGREAVGLILCRPDGSDARGIALGQSPSGGQMPIYTFTSDSRLIVGNNIVAEFTGPEEYAITLSSILDQQLSEGYRDSVHYYNIETMSFESREYRIANQEYDLYPHLCTSYIKCPWNDIAVFYRIDGGGSCSYFEFRPLTIEDPIIGYEVPGEYPDGYPIHWLTEDELLFNSGGTLGVLRTDGTFSALPDSAMGWSFFNVLEDSTCNFRRGHGEPLEYGLIRWDDFNVLWSRIIE